MPDSLRSADNASEATEAEFFRSSRTPASFVPHTTRVLRKGGARAVAKLDGDSRNVRSR